MISIIKHGPSIGKGGIPKVVIGTVGGLGTGALVYLIFCAFRGESVADQPLTGTFTTQMGEHRCENLPDASQTCLNTNSVVRYTFNRQTRNVELVSGEASFAVRGGDRRPFDVVSGGVLIHDLSTQFNIYKKDRSTVVTVVQGRVRVVAPINTKLMNEFKNGSAESLWKRAPEFHRLQQVEFDETTGTLYARSALTEDDLIQLTEWQHGRIDLNGKTLRESLTELARYQPIDQFNIPDRALREFKIGGELDTTNLMDFLQTLEYSYHIHHLMTKGADGKMTVTLSRRPIARSHSTER
jgi:transmembrane sensor